MKSLIWNHDFWLHNSYYDNGIKILDGNGHKMDAGVENLIEQYIDGLIDELPYATKDEIGRL